MVASNIHDCGKPVVGINTDPIRWRDWFTSVLTGCWSCVLSRPY